MELRIEASYKLTKNYCMMNLMSYENWEVLN